MRGEQCRPLEEKPYLKQYQARLSDQKTIKVVKPKPRKKRTKAVVVFSSAVKP